MTENIQKEIKLRQRIALLSAFLLPFISQYFVNDKSFELSLEDKEFIKSYILPGYLVLWGILIVIILSLINYFYFLNTDFIYFTISTFIKIIFFLIIVFDLYLVYNIFVDNKFNFSIKIKYKEFEDNFNINNILYLFPGISFYFWYNNSVINFNQRYFFKESIIISFLIVFVAFLSINLSFLIFLLYFSRLILLYFKIDIVSNKIKSFVFNLFNINIEEVFAYLLAFINKFFTTNTYFQLVEKYKKIYETLVDFEMIFKDKKLILQYIFLFIFLIYISYYLFDKVTYNNIFVYFLIFILWFRYIVLILYKKLVYIPVLNEFITYTFYIFEKTKKNEKNSSNPN